MPETKKFETNPLSIQLNGDAETRLDVSFDIFEATRNIPQHVSDTCAEWAIAARLPVKNYLDKVPQTGSDAEIIANPERIVGLYELTSEVLRRNIRLMIALYHGDQDLSVRHATLQNSLLDYCLRQKQEVPSAVARIIAWCAGEKCQFPVNEMGYYGCEVESQDILDADSQGIPDVRPNFRIQRQYGGCFIMAYTNKRVCEKLARQDQLLDRRIYLNPDLEAAPLVFERLLQIANEEGISLQMKMLQRAPEVASAHLKRLKGRPEANLRGDGIVVFVNHQDADQFLKQALAIAECNAEIFKGRHISHIPHRIVDGIAIGDEPQVPGYSLTSHRAKILDSAATIVRRSGKQGVEAYDLFREATRRVSEANDVNPRNIAFNKEN